MKILAKPYFAFYVHRRPNTLIFKKIHSALLLTISVLKGEVTWAWPKMDLNLGFLGPSWQHHMRVAWGRVAPVPTAITERNWRKEGAGKRGGGERSAWRLSRAEQPAEALGFLGGRSMRFITVALSLRTLFPGCQLSTGVGARASTGPWEQTGFSWLWPESLLRALVPAGDKTNDNWDDEAGRVCTAWQAQWWAFSKS